MDSTIVVLVAAGASVALGFAWLALVLRAPVVASSRVHERDRVPLWWRLCAPLSRPIAGHIAPLLSARVRFDRRERLRHAGLEFALDAELFVAGQCVAAIGLALLVALAWSPRGWPPAGVLVVAAVLGFLLPSNWLRERVESRRRALLRELPFYLDVITLAVESGSNLSGALAHAVDKGPRGPLRDEFERFLRDVRAGRDRREALRDLARRVALPAVGSLVAALLLAETQGMSLGPVLRAQAEQRRTERFLRAERLAMEAPVKMLAPLLVFIFPCTFVMLLFPLAARMLEEGWLR
ncbi:MAG: type II secretion system F family protein [Burkholderiaceae bacterium]|nr:type II secretion system F family protein [Burkholderiaceae bacterium]